jgi:hypothetical protein
MSPKQYCFELNLIKIGMYCCVVCKSVMQLACCCYYVQLIALACSKLFNFFTFYICPMICLFKTFKHLITHLLNKFKKLSYL